MQKRRLGQRGLEVSAIGLDCKGMSQGDGFRNEAESAATIDRALAAGCNFFDTADANGPYANEELLGRCLRGRREEVVIATHVGFAPDDKARHPDSRPARIRRAVDASLRRLRTDRIDLLFQHRIDLQVPMEDVAGTVRDLIAEGKLQYFGLSEPSTDTIRRAHLVQPVTAVQANYSLWDRGLEERILPVLFDLGIGLVPLSPLGNHAVGRDPAHNPGDQVDTRRLITDVVREIAVAHDALPAQIALAWVLSVNRGVVPLHGSQQRYYLEENFASAELQLTEAELEILDELSAPGPDHGPRDHEHPLALLNT